MVKLQKVKKTKKILDTCSKVSFLCKNTWHWGVMGGGGGVGVDVETYQISYGNSVTYIDDGTSLRSVRQIRRTDNLRSIIWVTLEHS